MKRLSLTELRKYWAQVPDQLIWKNLATGEFIAVHGSRDKAWYVVRKTTPTPDPTGAIGTVKTRDISPYFILPSKPVGEVGRDSNATVREERDWQYGTLNDALTIARNYMQTHYTNPYVKKPAWKKWRR